VRRVFADAANSFDEDFRRDTESLEEKAREFSHALMEGQHRADSLYFNCSLEEGVLPGRLCLVICCMVAAAVSAVVACVRSRAT
jgi:hypothetical protein